MSKINPFDVLGKIAIAPNGQKVIIDDIEVIALGHVLSIKVKYLTPWWKSKTLFFRRWYFYDEELEQFKFE